MRFEGERRFLKRWKGKVIFSRKNYLNDGFGGKVRDIFEGE